MSTEPTPQDHLAAALPTPGRVAPKVTENGACTNDDCEHRAWGNPTLAPDYMEGH